MAKASDRQNDKQNKELQKSADRMQDLSDDLVKMAQKIADSDGKAKQKLIAGYQATLRALSDLQKDQTDMLKTIIRNIGN